MGLGNRNARRHGTRLTAGVDPSDYWDFKPGQTVMTVDGFLGKVTAVDDGPIAGGETYDVMLNNGLGGGQYTASQLRASSTSEASANTAALDYPELAEILSERVDPGKYPSGRMASLQVQAEANAYCPSCGTEAHYSEGDDSVSCPECHTTIKTSTLHEGRYFTVEEMREVGRQAVAADPHGRTAEEILRAQAGTFAEPNYVMCPGCGNEMAHFGDGGIGGQGEKCHHCGTDLDAAMAQQNQSDAKTESQNHPVISTNGWTCDTCGGEVNGQTDESGRPVLDGDSVRHTGARHQADLMPGQTTNEGGAPGVCDNGHLTWGGVCPACRDTDVSQNAMVVNKGDNKPNHEVRASAQDVERQFNDENPASGDGCTVCGDSGHDTHQHVDDSVRSEIDGLFGPGAHRLISEQHGQPTKYSSAHTVDRGYEMVRQAMHQPDFGFHITATWADVRRKAKRIRSEGGVHITESSGGMVTAHVQGDNDTYESTLLRAPGSQKVAQWDCACPWAKYHWGAPDDYSRFAGRMCSHALALNFEAQSRGMFGRDVNVDVGAPSWLRKGDQALTASKSLPDCAPIHIFAAHALHAGEDAGELFFLLSRIAAVSSPFGEPAGNYSPPQPGPTMPKNPSENPASAGFLTGSDPASWSGQGPSMGGTTASLDDAVFEPEIAAQASLDVTAGPAALVVPLLRAVGPMVVKHVIKKKINDETGDEEDDVSGANQVAQHINGWTNQDKSEGDAVRRSMTGSHSQMHDAPEPALPSTDSAAEDEQTYSGYAGDLEPDPMPRTAAVDQNSCSHDYVHNAHGQCTNCGRIEETEDDEPCEHPWCIDNEAEHSKGEHIDPAHLDPFHPDYQHAERTADEAMDSHPDAWMIHHQPTGPTKYSSVSTGTEYGLPSDAGSIDSGAPGTNFKTDPTSLEPEDPSFVSTGSIEDIVAEFQRTAGAAALDGAGPSQGNGDIAQAAREHLSKSAMAQFSPGEQRQLIDEGEGTARAANLDRLEITGTHYEALEGLTNDEDDDSWLA